MIFSIILLFFSYNLSKRKALDYAQTINIPYFYISPQASKSNYRHISIKNFHGRKNRRKDVNHNNICIKRNQPFISTLWMSSRSFSLDFSCFNNIIFFSLFVLLNIQDSQGYTAFHHATYG